MPTLRRPPFPGMDPYLEAPDVFPSVHHALAVELRAMLNTLLPPPYYANIETRSELGIVLEEGSAKRIIPDVVIVRAPPRQVREAATAYTVTEPRAEATPGVELKIGEGPFHHLWVEVRDSARGHKLVTLIEIVSPSNKRPGPDRKAYLAKQREVLESDANLIEIDLLRAGERLLPYAELDMAVGQLKPHYLVVINRSASRESAFQDYVLHPFSVRETLPCIAVPLAPGTADVLLDLQVAFERVYLEGPYLRMLDYTQTPDPPLSEDDVAWAADLLRAAGLHPA